MSRDTFLNWLLALTLAGIIYIPLYIYAMDLFWFLLSLLSAVFTVAFIALLAHIATQTENGTHHPIWHFLGCIILILMSLATTFATFIQARIYSDLF